MDGENEHDLLLEAFIREELKLSGSRQSLLPMKSLADRAKESARSSKEVFRDLITSIAQEEAAIAQLIHAKSAQIEAFTGKNGEFPTGPSNQQIVAFQETIARSLEAIVEKQKLLLRLVEICKRLSDQSMGVQSDGTR